MRMRRVALAVAALSFIATNAGTAEAVDGNDATELQRAQKKRLTHALRARVAALRARQATIRNAATTLRRLSKEQIPSGLPAADRSAWPKFVGFLRASQTRVVKVAGGWTVKLGAFDKKLDNIDASGDSAQLLAATKEMREMNNSFNLQYLQLQQDMQSQNRQFTLVSNVMKIKHDTAKSAINNIR